MFIQKCNHNSDFSALLGGGGGRATGNVPSSPGNDNPFDDTAFLVIWVVAISLCIIVPALVFVIAWILRTVEGKQARIRSRRESAAYRRRSHGEMVKSASEYSSSVDTIEAGDLVP